MRVSFALQERLGSAAQNHCQHGHHAGAAKPHHRSCLASKVDELLCARMERGRVRKKTLGSGSLRRFVSLQVLVKAESNKTLAQVLCAEMEGARRRRSGAGDLLPGLRIIAEEQPSPRLRASTPVVERSNDGLGKWRLKNNFMFHCACTPDCMWPACSSLALLTHHPPRLHRAQHPPSECHLVPISKCLFDLQQRPMQCNTGTIRRAMRATPSSPMRPGSKGMEALPQAARDRFELSDIELRAHGRRESLLHSGSDFGDFR